jgi:hypothetical protein
MAGSRAASTIGGARLHRSQPCSALALYARMLAILSLAYKRILKIRDFDKILYSERIMREILLTYRHIFSAA